MEISMFFEIPPSDIWVIGRVIGAIPPVMDHVTGRINAQSEFIALGMAAPHTGLNLNNASNQLVVGEAITSSKGEAITSYTPDLHALLVKDMLPGFVSFKVVGGPHRLFDLAKEVAAKYVITKGYRGSIVFRNRDGTAVCDIRLERWLAEDSLNQEEIGDQPPRIRVAGQAITLKPILIACRSMRLRQYLPTRSPA